MTGNRTILVTGASRGIGAAVSQRLLQQGCRVIAVARRFNSDVPANPHLRQIHLDLGRLDALPTALGGLVREHPEIDALICNAGQGRFGTLEQFSEQQIRQLIDLNLTSQILIARAFLPLFKARRQGDLVFMGSEAALTGGRKGAVYCATKFGLRGLAQSLREECAGTGVRVGIVNPGMVKTDFFDALDFRPDDAPDCHLTPADVAEAVWTMLSARAGAAIDEINMSPEKKVIRFGSKD